MLRRILRRLRQRLALRRCIREVGSRLVQRYGAEKHYSPGRIRATLDAAGVDRQLLMLACAMYASLADFSDWVRTSEEAVGRSWIGWSARDARGRYGDHAELYRLLRRKAASANGNSYRFLPDVRADHDEMGRGPDMPSGQGSSGLNNFRWYE
jgi:hypothetical protein